MARHLLNETPRTAKIGLHGSFAATGQGHGTDRALVAGLLGFPPDDERLKDALQLAESYELFFELEAVDLGEEVHPNTAQIVVAGESRAVTVTGASVGGGAVVITNIDTHRVELRGQLESLVVWHADSRGFLAGLTAICASVELNIATVRTSRRERGEEALTTVEVDGAFEADVLSVISRSKGVHRLVHLPILPGF
jgi:L-serine dehydratase